MSFAVVDCEKNPDICLRFGFTKSTGSTAGFYDNFANELMLANSNIESKFPMCVDEYAPEMEDFIYWFREGLHTICAPLILPMKLSDMSIPSPSTPDQTGEINFFSPTNLLKLMLLVPNKAVLFFAPLAHFYQEKIRFGIALSSVDLADFVDFFKMKSETNDLPRVLVLHGKTNKLLEFFSLKNTTSAYIMGKIRAMVVKYLVADDKEPDVGGEDKEPDVGGDDKEPDVGDSLRSEL